MPADCSDEDAAQEAWALNRRRGTVDNGSGDAASRVAKGLRAVARSTQNLRAAGAVAFSGASVAREEARRMA